MGHGTNCVPSPGVIRDSPVTGLRPGQPGEPCGAASAPRGDGAHWVSHNKPCAASPCAVRSARRACGSDGPPPESTRRNAPVTSPQAIPPLPDRLEHGQSVQPTDPLEEQSPPNSRSRPWSQALAQEEAIINYTQPESPRQVPCGRAAGAFLTRAASLFDTDRPCPNEFVRAGVRVRLYRGASSFVLAVEFVCAAVEFVCAGRRVRCANRRVRSRQPSSSFAPTVEFVCTGVRVRLYRRSSSFVPGFEFVCTAGRVRSCRGSSSFVLVDKLFESARSTGSLDSSELPRNTQTAPAAWCGLYQITS